MLCCLLETLIWLKIQSYLQVLIRICILIGAIFSTGAAYVETTLQCSYISGAWGWRYSFLWWRSVGGKLICGSYDLCSSSLSVYAHLVYPTHFVCVCVCVYGWWAIETFLIVAVSMLMSIECDRVGDFVHFRRRDPGLGSGWLEAWSASYLGSVGGRLLNFWIKKLPLWVRRNAKQERERFGGGLGPRFLCVQQRLK